MTLLRVYSEIGPLRRVLLRRPSFEQQLLTPNKMKKYLFDDILHLSTAQREHDVFTSCLRRLGADVICFDDLLLTGLQNGGAASIFQARIGQKMGRKAIDALMANLSNQVEALRFIIDGVHEKVPPTLNLTPLLNTIFTRDLGFVAGESFISVNASRNVRKGEVRTSQGNIVKSSWF